MKLFHFIEEKRLQNIDMNTKIVKSDEQENEKEVLQHYINGKTMTLEDVALCSLCGPILFPQNYCVGIIAIRSCWCPRGLQHVPCGLHRCRPCFQVHGRPGFCPFFFGNYRTPIRQEMYSARQP